MRNYFATNYQLYLLVLLYVVVGVYAKPFLFLLMPLSVFFLKSRELWADMVFGLLITLVLSDITPWFFKMQVFKSAKNFDPEKKFSSWVYKIALNEVKRHWKKSAAKQTFSLNTPVGDEGSDSERQDFIEDFRDLPENVLERENFSETLKVLIDRLPEKQRTVVILKIYHELTFEEIAEICECPLSTVLSRMRYAVNKLRRWLGVEED